jgi:hypothetical protein
VKTLRSIVTVACALSLAGCGLDVMYADWKVDRLCKQDGGVKVFETDSPPAEFRMPDGNVNLDALQRAKPEQSYYVVHNWTVIKPNDPTISRLQIELIRGSDKKLLGTTVEYIRPMQNVGVPFLHRRGYICPANAGLPDLSASVFFPNSIPR